MRYKTIYDSEDQFQLARGAAIAARATVFAKWREAFERKAEEAEQAFYLKQVEGYDKLIQKYDAELARDKSQDAAPESDDEDEEQD